MRFWEEATYGVVSGSPTFTSLRFTGESLGMDTTMVESAEITGDRNVADHIRTSVREAGDVQFELSYSAYDTWLMYLLQSAAWSSAVTVLSAGSASVVAATNKFTHATAWTATPTANMWIKTSGFSTAANNGYWKVASADGTNITVTETGVLVDEGPTASVTITQGAQIVSGSTFNSIAIEKEFQDLSNEFALLTGLGIDTFALNEAADGLVTGSFGLVGKSETSQTATSGDGSPTAAPTNDPMNATDHIVKLLVNNVDTGHTAFAMNYNNKLRTRLQVGTLGAVSIGSGTIGLAGTFQGYFTSKTVIDYYIAQTELPLALVLEDGAASANAYVFDMPAVKLTAGKRVAGAKDQDVLQDMGYAAKADATEDIMMRVVRFPGS